jgi:hypothetical protein
VPCLFVGTNLLIVLIYSKNPLFKFFIKIFKKFSNTFLSSIVIYMNAAKTMKFFNDYNEFLEK